MTEFTDISFLQHSTTKQVVYLELRSHPHPKRPYMHICFITVRESSPTLLMVQVYGCSSLGGSEGNHDLGMTFVIWID